VPNVERAAPGSRVVSVREPLVAVNPTGLFIRDSVIDLPMSHMDRRRRLGEGQGQSGPRRKARVTAIAHIDLFISDPLASQNQDLKARLDQHFKAISWPISPLPKTKDLAAPPSPNLRNLFHFLQRVFRRIAILISN